MQTVIWKSLSAAIIGLGWLSAAAPHQAATCLAVGVGTWTPELSGAIWTSSRRVRLTPSRDTFYHPVEQARQWRVAELEPLQGKNTPTARNPEYERAWVWSSPVPDSLVMLRPAILSEGFELLGAWTGDTLHGRAHAFSDAVGLRSPRANAYGVRYSCKDKQGAVRASAVLETLRTADVPDSALAAREDSLWIAEVNARLRR